MSVNSRVTHVSGRHQALAWCSRARLVVICLQFCVGEAVSSGRAVRVNFKDRDFFVPPSWSPSCLVNHTDQVSSVEPATYMNHLEIYTPFNGPP